MRVETGITNLGISGSGRSREGFFYAPDPSSQLACTLAGNIAMNSGGAHCLKYGVTTNNVLGLRMVLMDGEIIEIGGATSTREATTSWRSSSARKASSASSPRRPCASCRAPRARGRCCSASTERGGGRSASPPSSRAGIIPVAIEFMDKPAIAGLRGLRQGRLSARRRGAADRRGRGLRRGDRRDLLRRIVEIAKTHRARTIIASVRAAEQSAAIWKGRKAAFGAIGRISDYYCMDGTIPLGQLAEVLAPIAADLRKHGLQVANIFHAGDGNLHPLILYDANDADAGRARPSWRARKS